MWKYASRNSASRTLPGRHRGLTLTEVVVSTMIVGMMTVAALNGLGSATRSGELAGNRGIALGMADELMAEILATPYSDPSGTFVFGPEPGESNGTRINFDDVDDYSSWTEQPPRPKAFRGVYNNATAYIVGDAVTYLGAPYSCIQNSTGHLPTDTDFWQSTGTLDAWRRSVTVDKVVPTNPTQLTPGGADQGAKRILVTVECNGVKLAEHTAIVTNTDE